MSERLQSVFWLLIVIFSIVFLVYNFKANAAAPFDHSNCQYPDRLSNPPDGCNNTDPARPECMKFGLEDCDLPTQEVQTPTPVKNVDPAPSEAVVSEPEPVFTPVFEGK